jgi:hypothetical protein
MEKTYNRYSLERFMLPEQRYILINIVQNRESVVFCPSSESNETAFKLTTQSSDQCSYTYAHQYIAISIH